MVHDNAFFLPSLLLFRFPPSTTICPAMRTLYRVGAVSGVLVALILLVMVRRMDPQMEHTATLWAYWAFLPLDEARSRTRETYMKSVYGGDFVASVVDELLATNYTLPHRDWPSERGVSVDSIQREERCYFMAQRYLQAAERTCGEYQDYDTGTYVSAVRECEAFHREFSRHQREACQKLVSDHRLQRLYKPSVCSPVVVEASLDFVRQHLLGTQRDDLVRVVEIPHFDAAHDWFLSIEGQRLPQMVIGSNVCYESAIATTPVACRDYDNSVLDHSVVAAREIQVTTVPLETQLAWERYAYFSNMDASLMTTLAICKKVDLQDTLEGGRVPTRREWASTIMADLISSSLWLNIHQTIREGG